MDSVSVEQLQESGRLDDRLVDNRRRRLLFTGGVQLDVLHPMATVPAGMDLNDESPVA